MEKLTPTELTATMRYNSFSSSHTFHMCQECNKKGCRRYKCNECIQKELDVLQEKVE